jgi:hypothetical protein
LNAREAAVCGEIVKSVVKEMAASRARFERRIGVLLGRASERLRQAEAKKDDCHAPA